MVVDLPAAGTAVDHFSVSRSPTFDRFDGPDGRPDRAITDNSVQVVAFLTASKQILRRKGSHQHGLHAPIRPEFLDVVRRPTEHDRREGTVAGVQ